MSSVDPLLAPFVIQHGQASFADSVGQALRRIRFQLGGGLFFAVAAPALLRGNFERFADQVSSYDNSLAGSLCALLIGYMIFRKVTALPGAGAGMNVLPAFMVSYAALATVFFLLRLDYSRYQFLMSFVMATGWFYTVLFVTARINRPKLAILRNGYAATLGNIRGVEWVPVNSVEDASSHRDLPLIVDLKSGDLTKDWERYIAEQAIDGRPVFNAEQLSESLRGRVELHSISENSFGHLAPDSLYAPAKRYIDAALALVALIVLSPVLIATAVAVKLSSPGPIVFRQVRMGFRGRMFTVYKFRSMRVEQSTGTDVDRDMTRTDDARITKVGKFIRKTRIDELPQIINILKGEMSWIGPRPETMNLSEWYEDQLPFYRYRHIVRPGISGWAQVQQGHVTDVDDVREKLEYDFFYIKNFSLWMDVLIAIRTLKVIVTAAGAK